MHKKKALIVFLVLNAVCMLYLLLILFIFSDIPFTHVIVSVSSFFYNCGDTDVISIVSMAISNIFLGYLEGFCDVLEFLIQIFCVRTYLGCSIVQALSYSQFSTEIMVQILNGVSGFSEDRVPFCLWVRTFRKGSWLFSSTSIGNFIDSSVLFKCSRELPLLE